MAKPQKARPIRFDQFRKQLEEVGVNELQEVELDGDGSKIYIRLGVGVDAEATNRFMERFQEAETLEDTALEILGHHPDRTAQEQYDLLHEKWPGEDTDAQLIALWSTATNDMRERMGKLRPRRS